MSESITVEGERELVATLHRAAADLADMGTTNRGVGEVLRARAASNAPKVTGRLAGSVRVKVTATETVVASALVYARRVNYGMPSVGQPAQPFMTDALGDTQREIVARYERAIGAAISHVRGA